MPISNLSCFTDFSKEILKLENQVQYQNNNVNKSIVLANQIEQKFNSFIQEINKIKQNLILQAFLNPES